MPRSVFRHVLHDHRRSLLWWTVGLVGFVLIEMAAFPSIKEAAGVEDMWKQMPDAMKAMFGMDASLDFSSGAGFLEAELFGVTLPLCFAILAVSMGSKAVAGEEDDGLLELQLAHPISRTRFLLESFAAVAVIVTVPAIALFATLLIGDPVAGIDVSIANLAAAFARVVLFAVLLAGITIAIGSALGRRGLTAAIAGAATLTAFLLSSLGRLVDQIDPVSQVSPFRWLFGTHPVTAGFQAGMVVAVLVVAAAVAAATLAFNRRDLR